MFARFTDKSRFKLSLIRAIALLALSASVPLSASAQSTPASPLTTLANTLRRRQVPAELNNDFGMWTPVFLQYPITKDRRWQIYQEIQPRFTKNMERFEQLLLRQQLLYVINKHADVQCGYTFVRTYFPAAFDDHRCLQQLSSSFMVKKLAVYNRSRMEERFIEYRDGEVSVRFRHNLRLTYPLYRERIYSFISDELFVNLNRVNNGPTTGIDQNRLLVGAGVRVYRQLRFDVGYMNQYFNAVGNKDKMNHILWMGVSQNF